MSRNKDDLVVCGAGCPDTVSDYSWSGNITLTAPAGGGLWFWKIVIKGAVEASGTIGPGDTVGVGPFAPSGVPGGTVPIQVICDEAGRPGHAEATYNARFPACDCEPCELGFHLVMTEGIEICVPNDCAEGTHWDYSTHQCEPDGVGPPGGGDGTCPSGYEWDSLLGSCRVECAAPRHFGYESFACICDSPKIWNSGAGTCDCPEGYHEDTGDCVDASGNCVYPNVWNADLEVCVPT